jgi:Ca2+-binding EF-hand superfamily protein
MARIAISNMRNVTARMAWMCVLAACARGPVRADDPPAPLGEQRDMLLMLDAGPVHVRAWVALESRPLPDHVQAYVDRLMQTLDADGDGKLSKSEASASPLRSSSRQRNNPFLDQLDRNKVVSRAEIEQDVRKIFSDTVTYRQDDSAATNDGELFAILDNDTSGFVEPGEMRTAALRILDRDGDRDQCITLDELAPPTADPMGLLAPVSGVPAETAPPPTLAEAIRDGVQRNLIRDLVKQYDDNRDRELSADELAWDATRVAALDSSRNGQLAAEELARWTTLPPHLELSVELSSAGGGGQPVRVLASNGATLEQAPRPDLIRVKFGESSVTFSSRDSQPIEDAVAAALRVFNETDMDANGYLDETETAMRFRFNERGLFKEMDADADGKLFSAEMREYVAARAEPASITCRVNVYNTGFGFFQILDASGDGRISVRELRSVENTLRGMVRPEEAGLAQGTTGRNLHVEFVRNTFKLFGPQGVTVAQQTSEFIPRPAVGPDWFQAMDRNSDGDLTFAEFIGSERDFRLLDADGDELIDFREAVRADELFPLNEPTRAVTEAGDPQQFESADTQTGTAD